MSAGTGRKTSARRAQAPLRGSVKRAALPIAPTAHLQARADEAPTSEGAREPDRLLCSAIWLKASAQWVTSPAPPASPQPGLSQQLGVLRGEGLVATRRDDKSILYRIASPAVDTVLRTFYELFCKEGEAVH